MFSCSKNSETENAVQKQKNINSTFIREGSFMRAEKQINQLKITSTCINALDFLRRKKQRIDSIDIIELKKETVLILELESNNKYKSIFSEKEMKFDQNGFVEYAMSKICEDIYLSQKGKTILPNSSLYENSRTKINSIKLFFYFKDVNLEENYQLTFYDRIFGKGLIKLSFKNNV